MPRFRHIPTGRIIEAETHEQANRFRASHRMEEVFVQDATKDMPLKITGDHIKSVTVPGVPNGSIAEVLEWVGDDEERRYSALVHEVNNKARKTLIDKLSPK